MIPTSFSSRVRADAGVNALEGIGVSEAPRGTLFHHYNVDENGLIKKVNLIIATGHNNLAMNKTVTQIAKHYIQGEEIPEGLPQSGGGGHSLLRPLPVLFDPCGRANAPAHSTAAALMAIWCRRCIGRAARFACSLAALPPQHWHLHVTELKTPYWAHL
jgi:hypothetical protein